jgi:hypothetical protein
MLRVENLMQWGFVSFVLEIVKELYGCTQLPRQSMARTSTRDNRHANASPIGDATSNIVLSPTSSL